ncbi:STAS domain-containing protein [Mycolicibacterium aichiense]|uniref:STAS domain-containing protein n=1 Tax=Mycolicibacterium aichiense TaxID=1799 RepID=UPI003D669493
MHLFTCALHSDEQHAVAYLRGELDMSTVHCLIERLRPVAPAGRDLVIDLAGVTFFGAAGLVALDELDSRATAAGGSIRLAQLPAPVWRLLAATGTTNRFGIVQHGSGPTAVAPSAPFPAVAAAPQQRGLSGSPDAG